MDIIDFSLLSVVQYDDLDKGINTHVTVSDLVHPWRECAPGLKRAALRSERIDFKESQDFSLASEDAASVS